MKFSLKTLAAAAALAATTLSAAPAVAQEVTGAGASFPAPLYSRWAADYNKATNIRINYQSVGSGAACARSAARRSTSVPRTCR